VHNAQVNVSFTPPEVKLADAFVDYWTSFARYGDPNKSGRQSFRDLSGLQIIELNILPPLLLIEQ